MREECLRSVDDTPKVDVHQPFEVVERRLLDRSGHGDAGIVDDEVHPTMLAHDLIGPGDIASRSATSSR